MIRAYEGTTEVDGSMEELLTEMIEVITSVGMMFHEEYGHEETVIMFESMMDYFLEHDSFKMSGEDGEVEDAVKSVAAMVEGFTNSLVEHGVVGESKREVSEEQKVIPIGLKRWGRGKK